MSAPPAPPLSPTDRTRVTRGRQRAVTDRARLHGLLTDGLVAHVGVVVGDHPVVLPCAYAVDLDGPDDGGTLYLHGSPGAGWLRAAVGRTVCVTVTELDGLVLARSAFHHSMNYRSGVVVGTARLVVDDDERLRALDAIVDHMVPGRAATLRASTRKELAATAVLAVALHESSMKQRAGGPADDPVDVDPAVWAGHVPVRRVLRAPVSADDTTAPVPAHVVARAADVRALV